MMPRLLLLVSLAVTGCVAHAQELPPDKARRSTDIVLNLRRVELLNQIVPLILERDQVRAILPAVEKIRERTKRLMMQEHEELLLLEKQAAQAVADALKRPAKTPDGEFVKKVLGYQRAADFRRQVAVAEAVDADVLPVLKRTLNKGQLQAAARSLTLEFFEPGIQPTEATEDLRLRVFVREVLLDPLAYPILIQMSK